MATIGTSGWSIRFSPTPGRSATAGDAVLAQMRRPARRPDSISSCGVTSAPAATITSPSARAVCSAPARVAVGDADRAAVLDRRCGATARCRRIVRFGIALQRREERVGRAAALPAPVHELIEADAALRRPVEIVVEGSPSALHALHEPARDVVDVAGVGDQQRPVGAVPLVVQPVVALHAAEMRQHVGPAPAGIVVLAAQQLVPLVVVGRAAAHVDLRVHRGAAAEHVGLRDVVHAAVQMLLRHGVW